MPTSSPTDLGTLVATGSAATTPITTTAAAPIGALVVVIAQHDTAGGITFGTCVDSRSNTYTIVAQQGNGSSLRHAMYYSVLTTALQVSDTITVNLTGGSAANRTARAFYVTGTTATPLDKTVNSFQAAGISATTGSSGTLAQADELVVVAFGGANTATVTPSAITSGYTQFADLAPTTAKCLATAWQIVAATTAVTATVTWHVSENHTTWILATFKAVVGNTSVKTGFGAIG